MPAVASLSRYSNSASCPSGSWVKRSRSPRNTFTRAISFVPRTLTASRKRRGRPELVAHEVVAHARVQQNVVGRTVGVPAPNRVKDAFPSDPVRIDHRVRVVRRAMVGAHCHAEPIALVPRVAHHPDGLVSARRVSGFPALGRKGRPDVLVVCSSTLHDLERRARFPGHCPASRFPCAFPRCAKSRFRPSGALPRRDASCRPEPRRRCLRAECPPLGFAARAYPPEVPMKNGVTSPVRSAKKTLRWPLGWGDAPLVAEDAGVAPGKVVHVRHLLRIPPPIGVGPALVIR